MYLDEFSEHVTNPLRGDMLHVMRLADSSTSGRRCLFRRRWRRSGSCSHARGSWCLENARGSSRGSSRKITTETSALKCSVSPDAKRRPEPPSASPHAVSDPRKVADTPHHRTITTTTDNVARPAANQLFRLESVPCSDRRPLKRIALCRARAQVYLLE